MTGGVVAVSTNPAIDRIALAPAAMVAAALGARVRLVAPAGGALLGELLAAERVPAVLVPVAAPTRGTYTVVDPEVGDVLEVHEPSPTLGDDECEALVAAAAEAFAGAAVAVIAGSLPAGAPPDLHARLARAASAAGAFTVVDTSSAPALERALAKRPDLVTPNAAEAAALLGGAQPLEAMARALRERGARAVWLSAGPDGSLLADGAGVWHLAAPPPARVVNAVGCGDALVGGLAAGLARGLALLDAAALGVAAPTDKLPHPPS